LSLDDLAEVLQTSRQVISRYENGKAAPRTDSFLRLCAALEVLPNFFALDEPIPEASPLFFRHFKSKTPRKQLTALRRQLLWLRELISALEIYVVLPPVDLPDFSPPSDPLRIKNDDIEAAATALRRHWGFGDGVILDVVKLVESKGCIVASRVIDSDTIDAFSIWSNKGRPLIATQCRDISAAHSRFDLAHELGHLILHRRIDRRFVELNSETHKLIEQQAFRFAGAFLMPEQTFRRSVPFVSLDSLLLVKPQWQLSVAAMLHRAQDLEMVGGTAAQNLWINLTRRGWKKCEPYDSEIAAEEPRLLKNALLTLKESGGVESLAQHVGLSVADYERFAGFNANELSVSAIREYNPVTREEYKSKLA
jgi:Zn-dependent peptidase ImmA (M78 family)/transcriptional regulator with XRE-family HTH domain